LYHFKFLPWKYEKDKQKQEQVIIQEKIIKEKIQNRIEEIRKKIKFKKQEKQEIELTQKEKLDKKIEEIKLKSTNYKIFDLNNNIKAYFKEEASDLALYLDNKKIGTFNFVAKKYLLVEKIL
jgi:hypothetical protein